MAYVGVCIRARRLLRQRGAARRRGAILHTATVGMVVIGLASAFLVMGIGMADIGGAWRTGLITSFVVVTVVGGPLGYHWLVLARGWTG